MKQVNVRTQITLPTDLKLQIESRASEEGKSLAEYLREAATYYLGIEDKRSKSLKDLADSVIGVLENTQIPEWQTRETINAWVEELRQEWE